MIGKMKSKWKMSPLEAGIYSILEFAIILKRERIRADRGNSQFSLVLFKLNSNECKKKVKALINRFKQNIREIDYIGWHDDNTIGIILPGTGYAGAEHFINHFSKNIQEISCKNEIYSYPENFRDHNYLRTQVLKDDFSSDIPLWKITLDKMGAIGGFVIFSPILILLPLYIKLVSPGPVLYSQTRIGYKGHEFKFWKFRTMHSNTKTENHNEHLKKLINSDTPMTKLDEIKDPRIIPGGRILRKCCVDEIPQIYNILKGDMSLVGPRPCIPYEAEEFLLWHKYRFDINPGLTGLWQVSGKNKLTFKEMIRLDIKYSQNMSLFLDLRIIAETIPAIFKMMFDSILNKISDPEESVTQKKFQRRNV